MEDNIVNYGSITVPTKWEDVTLKKFSAIEKYYSDKEKDFNILDVLDIMIDKDKDWIMSLPNEFLDEILEKLVFLQTPPEDEKPSNNIEIDGETYIIHFENQLKVGELVAADTLIKNDKHNYAAMLAILCRKDGELYDSKYENEIFEDRVKLFEKQPITKILPLIGFFMNSYITLKTISLLCMKTQEAANHILNSIDNSHKIGRCKKYYLRWRVNRLQKSLKSINNMQETSYSTSHTSLKKGKWKRLKNVFRIT